MPAISVLVKIEFLSTLTRKTRSFELDRDSARRVTHQFLTHLAGNCFAHLPVTDADYAQAWDWLKLSTTPMRSIDALHLAVAAANHIPLVTCDDALAQFAARVSVDVIRL